MLLRAWCSYYASIDSFQKSPHNFKSPPRIPNYKGTFGDRSDGRYVVSYNKQAYSKRALKKGFVHPSGTEIMIKTKVREIEQVRFIPKKTCYVVEVVYNREEPQKKFSPSRIASIDLGLNNLATLTTNIPDYQPLIYDGRAIKSANQYSNKQNAILRKKLKNKKQVTKRIKRLWHKRNCKVDYYLHTTSKAIIDELVINQIGKLIVGWNLDFKDQINLGKINNQNFVNLPHHRLIEQLKYKGILAGIEVIETEESYTSVCSALDKEPLKKHQSYLGKRIKRGLFRTQEKKVINADLNGSLNIGRKVVGNGFIVSSDRGCVVQPVRIRPYKQGI